MNLEKYSIGIGDRFAMEGEAQLRAIQQAEALGVTVVPVWNKSNREHSIIGSRPEDTRGAADAAVKATKWKSSYYVDADHVGLGTVDRFLASSNFFTIDVADFIGVTPATGEGEAFFRAVRHLVGEHEIAGTRSAIRVTESLLREVAAKYLVAMQEAGRVYRRIAEAKGAEGFVTEVSIDEAVAPQSPAELLLILAGIAREGIPIQTIAPKFSGSFLKGIDYVGDVSKFRIEFEDDLAVVAFAVKTFHLPQNLKLSVHSGSDKFSLYPVMHAAIGKFDAGLHLKTAGTTWLEEVVGLAAADGEGLKVAKQIYAEAHRRYDELAKPYRTVIDIAADRLPDPARVASWSSAEFVAALRHDRTSPGYDRNFRQLIHIGYKVAAELGDCFRRMLRECRCEIEANVTFNILERHLRPLFLGADAGGSSANISRLNAAKSGKRVAP